MTTRPSDRATTLTTPEALAVLDEWAGSCAECDGEGIRAIPASLCSIPGDFEDCDGCADIRQARAHLASRIAELDTLLTATNQRLSNAEAELAAVRAISVVGYMHALPDDNSACMVFKNQTEHATIAIYAARDGKK